MAKRGRKEAIIDWEIVDNLLIAACPGTEIADHIGISASTLYLHCEKEKKTNFSAYSQQKRSKGNNLIRAAQFDEAVRKRDRGMLIWLGKNRLSQSDRDEISHKGNIPIQVVNYSNEPITPWKDNQENKKNIIKKEE